MKLYSYILLAAAIIISSFSYLFEVEFFKNMLGNEAFAYVLTAALEGMKISLILTYFYYWNKYSFLQRTLYIAVVAMLFSLSIVASLAKISEAVQQPNYEAVLINYKEGIERNHKAQIDKLNEYYIKEINYYKRLRDEESKNPFAGSNEFRGPRFQHYHNQVVRLEQEQIRQTAEIQSKMDAELRNASSLAKESPESENQFVDKFILSVNYLLKTKAVYMDAIAYGSLFFAVLMECMIFLGFSAFEVQRKEIRQEKLISEEKLDVLKVQAKAELKAEEIKHRVKSRKIQKAYDNAVETGRNIVDAVRRAYSRDNGIASR